MPCRHGSLNITLPDVFRARGYKVMVRGRAGDLGRRSGSDRITGKTCHRPVQTVSLACGAGDRARYVRHIASRTRCPRFLVTSAEISPSAHDWARNKPLTLIDGATLIAITSDLARKNGS